MRTLCIVVCLLAVGLFTANSASGLEIRVAPNTLVLSSPGGKLTVHTDVPFGAVEDVSLEVNETGIPVRTFADSRGNLVAQCTKAVVKEVIGEINGKKTTATVTLTVNGDPATETITVKN